MEDPKTISAIVVDKVLKEVDLLLDELDLEEQKRKDDMNILVRLRMGRVRRAVDAWKRAMAGQEDGSDKPTV